MDTAAIAYRSAIKGQVAEFIAEGCTTGPERETRSPDLRAAYLAYARQKGYQPLTPHMFGRLMRELNVWRRRDEHGAVYVGIAPLE